MSQLGVFKIKITSPAGPFTIGDTFCGAFTYNEASVEATTPSGYAIADLVEFFFHFDGMIYTLDNGGGYLNFFPDPSSPTGRGFPSVSYQGQGIDERVLNLQPGDQDSPGLAVIETFYYERPGYDNTISGIKFTEISTSQSDSTPPAPPQDLTIK